MKEKILGLDIGIASIGHAVVEYDDKNFNGKIIEAGSRIFDACETAKKESLNAQRRTYRMARRRLSRRSGRLRELKQLFISSNLLNEEQINNSFYGKFNRTDVWSLRKDALTGLLSVEEFYRIIHQIAKRRGFKSVRKNEEAKNEGELLKNLSSNSILFKNSEFQTIGEMFATIYTGNDAKRNKRDKYKNSIPRELLEEELDIIFEKQREFGAVFADKCFQKQIFDIIFFQRAIQSMEGMVGYCQFEKNEKRAPKAAYTSEIFTAVQKIINTHLIDEFGLEFEFDTAQIKQIIKLAHTNSKVTYKQVKKLLNLNDEVRFKGLKYDKKAKNKKTKEEELVNPEGSAFIALTKYQEFKKAIIEKTSKEYFDRIENVEKLFNNIAEVLTYEKSDDSIIAALKAKGVEDEIIDAIKDLSAAKVLHLSIKAMEKIIPYMLQGNKYHIACELAGYDFKNEKESKNAEYLPALEQGELTTNPVVNRAVSQTRKVVNALIRKYGKFDRIIIETARDLGKSAEERKKIEAGQNEFQKQKESARQRCFENGVNPDLGNNLLRFRLWEQQDGKCVYSQTPIDIKRLSEPNYTDIDHILPYSRSFDDSLNNKVLCLSDENRQKGNKTPYEYLCNKVDWYEYSQFIKTMNLPSAKTNRILRQEYHGNTDTFIARNLNDTRYMTVFIKDYIKENLVSEVETRNGSLTAFLRNQWGIKKIREENDKHHAIDAIVLACSTKNMVKYLSTISARRENYDFINHSKPVFAKPWDTFDNDLEKAINNVFVSRALVAKISGGMHEGRFRSPKHLSEGFTTLKTDIKTIDLKKLETMYDKERNYAVYNVLKERLEQFNGDSEKAFAKPVYMPLSEEKQKAGKKPHEIRSIKLINNSTSGILLPQGFANNDSMSRVDVFTKKDKKGKEEYYLVPIYVADFAKGILPNKVITIGKLDDEWREIDETFTFKFSLCKNTLISVNKTGEKEDYKMYYYKSTDRHSGTITVIETDNSNSDKAIRISYKGLYSLKKYQVDVLGNYYEVKQEKRQTIHFKGNKKK